MESSSNGSPHPIDLTPVPILDAVEVPPLPKTVPEKSKATASVMSASMEQFSGPMPHPGHLAKYEEICPGAAHRILLMAEQEAEHRRVCEIKIVDAQVEDVKRGHIESKRGQLCALTIVLVALIVSGIVVYAGHPIAGSCISGASIGGIVTTFIAGRRDRDKEEAPPTPPQLPKKRNRNKNRR
jgi:uncharacterized membrane protein